MSNFICVRKFENPPEAEAAWKRLLEAGIDAMLETEQNGSEMAPVAAMSKLMVREADTRRAIEALNIRKNDHRKEYAA